MEKQVKHPNLHQNQSDLMLIQANTHKTSQKRSARKRGGRIMLDSGVVSPLLGSCLTVIDSEVVRLSYGACVRINDTEARLIGNAIKDAGGAYRMQEHFIYSYHLGKAGNRKVLHAELLPWLMQYAKFCAHITSFGRTVEYSMFLYLADHALNTEEIKLLTGTTSVNVSLAKMRKSGLIELGGYVIHPNATNKKKRVRSYVLTANGRKLVELVCNALERKENTYKSILFNRK